MYAIVRTGGKQYRVEEGRTVTVERLPAEEGAAVELDSVLLIEDDGQVTVGSPTIEGARVLTEVEAHGRDKKIIVFKYRAKVRTRKKTGHRQHFTRLAVTEILRPGQESKIAKPKRTTRRKAATRTRKAAAKPADEAVTESGVEAPVAEEAVAAAPKPRARRKPAATKTGAAAKAASKPTARKSAAKAKAATPTGKAAAPKRKTARKKKDDDAADSPKATASAKSTATVKSTTAGEAEKKPARRRKATPPKAAAPKATPPKAARQDNKGEE